MKAEQEGKPYYIPSKRTLLKYADDNYYEQNSEFCALRDFLSYCIKQPAKRANDIASDLQLFASMGEQDHKYIPIRTKAYQKRAFLPRIKKQVIWVNQTGRNLPRQMVRIPLRS